MSSFLADADKNLFEIKPNGEGYLIGDFEFEIFIENGTFKIKSEEEILEEIVPVINKMNFKKEDEVFQELTREYDKLMNGDDEKSPLYTGQDVFELENDNHDLKFVDRIRIKNEDFNNDLYLVVFEYLDPVQILSLKRVSKTWKKLVETETLWKSICKRESINAENGSWFNGYKKEHSFAQFTFSECFQSSSFQSGLKYAEKTNNNPPGHVCFLGDKVWDKGVIKFKFLLEKNSKIGQNWFSYGIVGTNEKYTTGSFGLKTNFQFSYSGDGRNYCGEYINGAHHNKGQYDIKEGDVFVVTLDFNKLQLTSYNERSNVTMSIKNIDKIPYRAHFNLFGHEQKVRIIV